MKVELITVSIDEINNDDLFLRKKSLLVYDINNSTKKLISQMINTIQNIQYATGVSSIQLGVPLKIFVINFTREIGKEIICINPEILSVSGRIKYRNEGCLSLPNYKGLVGRRDKIHFKASDIEGNLFECKMTGYQASIVQHEFDHLEGILFWDKLKEGEKLLKI